MGLLLMGFSYQEFDFVRRQQCFVWQWPGYSLQALLYPPTGTAAASGLFVAIRRRFSAVVFYSPFCRLPISGYPFYTFW